MTDNEIVKALECCKDPECANCKECPAYETHKDCMGCVLSEAIDLINRQKAENKKFADIGKMYSEVKAEAIKEFWDELKKRNTLDERIVSTITGDKLVKEMVGENK